MEGAHRGATVTARWRRPATARASVAPGLRRAWCVCVCVCARRGRAGDGVAGGLRE